MKASQLDQAGKPIGKFGLTIGDVASADRPRATPGQTFICGDGEGGLVAVNSEGTKTLFNSTDTIVGADTTDSTSSTTGAWKTAGGLGVAKAAFIGTNLTVSGTTDSSSSVTGSLRTAGGLGVAKKAFAATGFFAPKLKDATDASGLQVTATTATLYAAGTKVINTEGSKLSFYSGTAAVVQYSALGTSTGFLSATGNPVLANSTFTGNTGTLAYTLGDLVRALKLNGSIKAS